VHLRTVLTIGITFTLAIAATASAQDTLFNASPLTIQVKTPRLFDVAPLRLAQDPAQAATTNTNEVEHQFGAGVRIGGYSFGLGGNVRYFFYGGPLGVQADLAFYSYSLDSLAGTTLPESLDWSAFQFSPSAIYRFPERRFQNPARLVPYAGVGMSFIHTYLDDEDDAFTGLFPDDTSVGLLLQGGVEIFFDNVPNLSVGGELIYVSNSEDLNVSAGSLSSLPWPAFVAMAHWYFW
jgi:hypothetical protein